MRRGRPCPETMAVPAPRVSELPSCRQEWVLRLSADQVRRPSRPEAPLAPSAGSETFSPPVVGLCREALPSFPLGAPLAAGEILKASRWEVPREPPATAPLVTLLAVREAPRVIHSDVPLEQPSV